MLRWDHVKAGGARKLRAAGPCQLRDQKRHHGVAVSRIASTRGADFSSWRLLLSARAGGTQYRGAELALWLVAGGKVFALPLPLLQPQPVQYARACGAWSCEHLGLQSQGYSLRDFRTGLADSNASRYYRS